MSSRMVLGTSITCSGTLMSKGLKTFRTGPPSAAQEHRGFAPWEQLRQHAPWCALEPAPVVPAARPDRSAASPGSSSWSWKSSGWGGGGFCRRGASCLSLCPSSMALVAVFSPRTGPFSVCTLHEWCITVARAMRIDCCSCLSIERSLRCSSNWPPAESVHHGDTNNKRDGCCGCCCCSCNCSCCCLWTNIAGIVVVMGKKSYLMCFSEANVTDLNKPQLFLCACGSALDS